jgi:hypothetical protein
MNPQVVVEVPRTPRYALARTPLVRSGTQWPLFSQRRGAYPPGSAVVRVDADPTRTYIGTR